MKLKKCNLPAAPPREELTSLKNMNKKTKIHTALSVLLIYFLALGVITVGVLVSGIGRESKASVLFTYNGSIDDGSGTKTQKAKVKRRGSAYARSSIVRRLLTQVDPSYALRDPYEDCVYTAPEKPQYKAEFLSTETKASSEAGGEFEYTLFVKNVGDVAWFSDLSVCASQAKMRLGTARDRDHQSFFYNPGDFRWQNPERIAMVEPRVNPGEIARFTVKGRAPRVNDIIREYYQPIVEGLMWVEGAKTVGYVDVYVGEIEAAYEGRRMYMGKSGQISTIDFNGERIIEIDISEQKLQYKFGNTVVREYTVSTGTFHTPTPLGRFEILNKQDLRVGRAKPHYHMPFWQGFTARGHGLHALPYLANDNGVFWEEALNHIGQRVSHGCVRMLNEDAQDLYNLTEVGTAIVIHE